MGQFSFDARSVDPSVALETLPGGEYIVQITKTEFKPVKDNPNNHYLEIEETVLDGEYRGRKIYDRLNLKNDSQQAQDIAYRSMSAICNVTGMLVIQDTAQLHGKPFRVVITKTERKDNKGEYSNNVKGYKDINGFDPGKGGQNQQQGGMPPNGGAGYAPQGGQPAYQGGAPQGWQNGGGAPQGGQPYQPQSQTYQGAPQPQPNVWQQPGAPQQQPQGGAPQGGQPAWNGQQQAGEAPPWGNNG